MINPIKKIFAITVLSLLVITGCHRESQDLINLKQSLGKPYNPVMTKTQKGNITAFNTVDQDQQKALSIILSSKASDITPWLKEHIGEYEPVYLYALTARMAFIEKAPAKDFLFWSNLAHLRAISDRILCKDKYVGQYLTILKMDLIRPAAAVYEQEIKQILQDEKQFTEILKQAAEWDKNHPQNNSPVWFCSSGHGVSTTETYPQEEWQKRRADFKKKYTASLYK